MTDRPLIPPPPDHAPTVGMSAATPEPEPTPAAATDRLPRWWKPKPALAAPSEPEPDEEDEPQENPDEDDQDQTEDDEDEGEEEDRESGPARKGKAAKKPGKKRRTDDRSLRVIAFNGVAAGVGYSAGLVPVFGQWLPTAEHAATGMVGLTLAAASAASAWRLTGHPAVHGILPYAPVARTLITVGAAELGRRWAPAAVAWLNQHGTQWGLGPGALSLLLTAGGMCGGLYWFVDRRARAWHWMARLLVRIPLASALLATALYAPGPTS